MTRRLVVSDEGLPLLAGGGKVPGADGSYDGGRLGVIINPWDGGWE